MLVYTLKPMGLNKAFTARRAPLNISNRPPVINGIIGSLMSPKVSAALPIRALVFRRLQL